MNLRKRIFLVLVSLLVVLGIAACTTAADTVKIAFGSDDYSVREGQTISLDINITTGSNYDAEQVKKELVYTSSDETVAKFINGQLIGVGIGEAEIKVEWSQKAIVFDKANVTVISSTLPEIVFTEYSPNMLKGATQTIGYKFNPVYTDASVKWESANPEIATVDQNGQVTAVAVGEATIIAYAYDQYGEKAFIVKINVSESDFAIEYELNGGVNSEANPAGYNTLKTPLELAAPAKLGYTFLGWYADAEFTQEAGVIAEGSTGDVKVYAKWEVNTYNISYELNGGAAEGNPATYTVEDAVEFAAPTKLGYEFLGWYADAEFEVACAKVEKGSTGDVKVYAKWAAVKYTINYDLDGGVNNEANPQEYTIEDEVVFAEPSKDNHSFLGWVDGEGNAVTKIEVGSTGEVTVVATWKIDAFNITYDLNGGYFPTPYPYATYEEVVADFLNDYNTARNKSHTVDTFAALGSWSEISDASLFLYNTTYKAKWSWLVSYIATVASASNKKAYEVFYDYSGQSDFNAANSNYIYMFAYELRGFVSHAQYTKNANFKTYDYSQATYDDLKAFMPKNENVEEVPYQYTTGKVTKLPTPLKADHDFLGWAVAKPETITASANSNFWGNYANHIFLFKKGSVTSALYSFRVSITRQEDGSYQVSKIGKSGDADYDYSGDYVLMISDSYANVKDTEAFKAAVKVGDTVNFDGDPSTGNATISLVSLFKEISAEQTGDLNVKAVYALVKDNFGLSYETDGGELSANAPSEYLSSTGLTLDMTASKPGYKFLGWSLTKGGSVVTEIAKGTRDDVTLYAVFELATYKITYELNGGTFSVDSVAYIYDNFEAIVADFLADYAAKYGLSGLTASNFNSKSANYGLAAFWKDATLSAKWAWLQEFMLSYNTSYAGLTYMNNPSSATNYNKYWRANLAAFLQQGKVNSPLSMDFAGLDTEAWWAENVPTKVVTVAANPKYEYTIAELPFTIEVPMRDGVEFVGWCADGKYRETFLELAVGTMGDITLYATWSDTEAIYETFDIIYELDFGRFEEEYENTYVETVGLATLPTPVKVGYTFVGWTLTKGSSEFVNSIGTEVTGDVTLYAVWKEKESSMPKVILVGAEQEYKTLAEALAVAVKGDTIVLEAGEYAGAKVDKTVTIKGPNAGVNPNLGSRAGEAVIVGDLVLANNNIVIDGIKLTGAGKIKADASQSLDGITLTNIVVDKSTANVGNVSNTAPFDLAVDGANKVSNVVITNNKFSTDASITNDRPMILHVKNIHNLLIDGNEFVGRFVNYNDAIKIGNGATVGMTGNLIVTNNHFENYSQYLIWLCTYAAVNVLVENNTFLNNGQTAGSHGVIRFASFKGTADDQVNCEMYYNTVDNSYMLLRIDSASALSASNTNFVCNYNTVINSKDSIIVKNSSTGAKVTCDSNYWGFAEIKDSMFVNATHTNDLTSAEEIPSQEDAWLNGKLIVGADATYKTIAEALAAAKEGDEIYLTAGTYDEEITISIANLTIYGPNHGVAGTAERKEEAVLGLAIVVEAAGFTLDGVQFGAGATVLVKANDTTITNVHSVSTSVLKNGTTNRNAVIVTDGAVANFELSNSYFNIGTSYYLRGVFANDTAVTNAKFVNNYFTHEGTTNSTLSDCIAMYNSAGVIEFIGNTFDWITDDWCIMLGSTGCNAEVINVIDNSFVAAEGYYTCGLMLRKAPAGCQINVIHNYFGTLSGTILSVRYSVAGSVCNVKYNVYENTAYRQDKYAAGNSNLGAATMNYEGNYYGLPLPSSYVHATDYGIVTDPATCDELYAAWKISQEMGESEVYSDLSYVLNGGEIEAGYDVKYLEGQKVALYEASKEGFKFLGWSLDAEGTKTYKEVQKDWTGAITLYAQYVEIFNITYELDGGESDELVLSATNGTTVKLPTPAKYGQIFLGWSLVQGSEEYVKEIKLTSNVTVYANWLEATFFYVNYELNGGSILYASRAELVQDFVNDYSSALGKGYSSAADIATGSFADIDYHTFMDKNVELANGQTPREKWLWLAEYLYELSVRDCASNNCNVLGLRALINQTAYSGDMIYGISYAFRAFLLGTTIRPGTSYTSVDHSVYENANNFWAKLSAGEVKTYGYYEETTLPNANLENYKFEGWYRNAELTGEKVTKVSHADDGVTLYAKFIEATPVTSITIDNKQAEIKRFETLQLTWTINPAEAQIKTVEFSSSNPNVASIDDKGFITAIANGTTTITIKSKSSSGVTDSFTLEVYSPDHFNAEYVTESYVAIDGSVELFAEYIKRDGSKLGVTWSSLNTEIATVDANGKVTGVNAGVATIRATVSEGIYYDFVVTVVASEVSEALQFAIDSHESNHFLRYDLSIGGAYLADIFGSVSKIFYNHEMKINTDYQAAGNATNDYYANSTKEQGLEFITVHYTAGFDSTADTDNHASYFTSGSADVSIHYVTGNKGSNNGVATDEIYATLDHQHGAWHAGDSNARYYSNSDKKNASGELIFSWMPTGVKADSTPLLELEWTASDDFYFEINGQKTSIKLPNTYDYKSRGTTHVYNADGTISSTATFNANYSWAKIDNRPVEEYFNSQDFPVKIVDGEYYMGPTWWSYGQNVAGLICGSGGNLNSIGIESCVNRGSDLWYTWQVTAQLVASLMVQYDLGIERVKGHHFFDGKHCPAPMLENSSEIWYEFIELVEAEYALLTAYKDAEFKLTVGEGSEDILSENGRIIAQPEFSKVVTYTVEVKVGDKTETITLATAVEGMYNR